MIVKLYNALLSLGGPLLDIYLQRRLKAGREDGERFAERRGAASLPRPRGPLIWMHGASVGESLSMLPLIKRLLTDDPKLHILVTSGTITSADLLAKRLPKRAFHQYIPVDKKEWVARFFTHWKPDIALLFESEFWPNLLTEITKNKIPAALINARLTEASYRRWRFAPVCIKKLLGCFTFCLAQTEEDAARLETLGAQNVSCVGNLKFAAAPVPVDAKALKDLQKQIGERPFWLFSSTHNDEEKFATQVHKTLQQKFPDLLTIIVPRHPKRGGQIRRALEQEEMLIAQRSIQDKITRQTQIYLADTLGEMSLFYALSEIAVIGNSFITPGGGHNLIEAAHGGNAILYGPQMQNFSEICAFFETRNAAQSVPRREDLADILASLLTNKAMREQKATFARQLAEEQLSVIDVVYDRINPLLEALK